MACGKTLHRRNFNMYHGSPTSICRSCQAKGMKPLIKHMDPSYVKMLELLKRDSEKLMED